MLPKRALSLAALACAHVMRGAQAHVLPRYSSASTTETSLSPLINTSSIVAAASEHGLVTDMSLPLKRRQEEDDSEEVARAHEEIFKKLPKTFCMNEADYGRYYIMTKDRNFFFLSLCLSRPHPPQQMPLRTSLDKLTFFPFPHMAVGNTHERLDLCMIDFYHGLSKQKLAVAGTVTRRADAAAGDRGRRGGLLPPHGGRAQERRLARGG